MIAFEMNTGVRPLEDRNATSAPALQGSRLPEPRHTRTYALDFGIDEAALLRYTSGAVSTYERSEIEHIVARCNWALKQVVRSVKRRRSRSAA